MPIWCLYRIAFLTGQPMIVGLKRDQSADGAIAQKKKWALCVVLTIVEE